MPFARGPWKADDHDDVAVELAGGERRAHLFLVLEHAGRRLHDAVRRVDGRHL